MNPVEQTQPIWELKPSTVHGTGMFARVDIAAETRIVEYVGERVNKEESERRRMGNNFFIFIVTDDFDIDGMVDWNPARFINHSCSPNCEAREQDEHIWVYALRDLKAGEEFSFNYGYDLEDYEDHLCRCGSTNCPGFMIAEEYFDEIKRLEALKRMTNIS